MLARLVNSLAGMVFRFVTSPEFLAAAFVVAMLFACALAYVFQAIQGG